MFSTWKQRLLLGIYIFLILSIPIGSYLASQQTNTKSKASEDLTKIQKSSSDSALASKSASPRDEIRNLLLSSPSPSPISDTSNSAQPSASPSASPVSAVSFGPTLNFKLSLEGRPANKQSSKVFVGITEGVTSGKQSEYLLSFTVDLPDNGSFEGLSIAGLDTGKQYTAYLKPTAQIATSSAFIMSPSITALNGGKTITLLTGDLNEDNVIDDKDYDICKAAFGTSPNKANWNPTADFNLDNTVNNSDLSYVRNNMKKTGESGPWVSSPSASLKNPMQNVGSPASQIIIDEKTIPQNAPDGKEGYWIWIPK